MNGLNHEWAKHGTCSGMNSPAYFHAADDAHKAVKLPTLLRAGENNRSVARSNLTQAILDANPTIARDGLKLMCVKGEFSRSGSAWTRHCSRPLAARE